MIKRISRTIIYIPEFDNNKEQPELERITVEFLCPTNEIKSRAIQPLKAQYKMDHNGMFEGTTYETELKDNYAAGNLLLKRINNCGWEDDDGKVNKIFDWMSLVKAPTQYSPLLSEVCKEAVRLLKASEVNEKNSE